MCIMRYIKLILFLVGFCAFTNVWAQLSTNEKPVSFGREAELHVSRISAKPSVIMPQLDVTKLNKEDIEDEEYDVPPRFGYPHRVNYDLNNSGVWYELSNGDKLWQLNVVCPNALSINFCYDKFWIPEGGKLFVYSKDKKRTIGAFTSKNNKGDREHIRGFATGLVYGSDVVLEYYQPQKVSKGAIISIEYVVHGYKYINIGTKSLGDAADCMVNINCEEGQNWQNEKKAVSLILVKGYRYCTGSLINTTDLTQKPYLLTADHCLGGWANDDIKYDAETSPNIDHYSFYWNYEAPGCLPNSVEPNYYSTHGATIIANNAYSDFALLRLSEDPKNLASYIPYYLGWDRTGLSGDSAVCIHHPKGDTKKISTTDGQPFSSYWVSQGTDGDSHWKVGWALTLNGHGMTQGGSSGSPLINNVHRVIGQLHGSNCNNCNNPNGKSFYGKFDVSWTGNNNNSIFRRLNCWIDSLNTSVQTMEGLLVIPGTSTMNTDRRLYSNIRITSTGQLSVQSDIELMGNSQIIVESGGELVIDGGTLSNVELVLKSGATLRILNDGILETKKGLKTPVGAIVDVRRGIIL